MTDLDFHNQAMIHRRVEAQKKEWDESFGVESSPLVSFPYWPEEVEYYGVIKAKRLGFKMNEVDLGLDCQDFYSRPRVLSLNWEPSKAPWET